MDGIGFLSMSEGSINHTIFRFENLKRKEHWETQMYFAE
jgi:hypothetical protein